MFIVERYALSRLRAAVLYFLMWKRDDYLDILLLLDMWLWEMLGDPDCLLQFFKEFMLRLFRNYLNPMLRDKWRLVQLQLGR